MSLRGKLELSSCSDTGLSRNHNEDSIGTDVELGLVVLADGMGGYKAGEVASAIAVNVIMDAVKEGATAAQLSETDEATGYSRASVILRDAVVAANRRILETARSEEQCQGMGTTVVTMLMFDNRMTVAHVGDSRLYRLRDGIFEQVTVDHSLLQELVDKGFYTPEEARKSVQKNLVTRALGVDDLVKTDVHEDTVTPGDIYLLCSDGLSDLVEDTEIHLTLDKYSANLEEAAQQLVAKANDAGGKDNISVILIRATKAFASGDKQNWYSKVIDWLN